MEKEYYLKCCECENCYEDDDDMEQCPCGGELEEVTKEYLSFDEYLKKEEGQAWDGIFNDMICEDMTEEDIAERKEYLLEQFYEYCVEHFKIGYEV